MPATEKRAECRLMADDEHLPEGVVLALLDLLGNYPRGVACDYLADLYHRRAPASRLPINFAALLRAHSSFDVLEDVVYAAIDDEANNASTSMPKKSSLVLENNNNNAGSRVPKKVSISDTAARIVYSAESVDLPDPIDYEHLLLKRTSATRLSPGELGAECLVNRPVLSKGSHRVLISAITNESVFYVLRVDDVDRRQQLWDDLAVNYTKESVEVTSDKYLSAVVAPHDVQVKAAFVCKGPSNSIDCWRWRRVHVESVLDTVISLPSLTSTTTCTVRCFDTGQVRLNVTLNDLRYCAPDVHDQPPLATRCVPVAGQRLEPRLDQACELTVEGLMGEFCEENSSSVTQIQYDVTPIECAPLRAMSLDADTVNCSLLHVDDGKLIFVQLDRAAPAPDLMRAMLKDVHGDHFDQINKSALQIGDHVCIRSKDGFERAVIIDRDGDHFRCYFSDIGCIRSIARSCMTPLAAKVNGVFKESFAVAVMLRDLHIADVATNDIIISIIKSAAIRIAVGDRHFLSFFEHVHVPVIHGDLLTATGDSITSLIIDRYQNL